VRVFGVQPWLLAFLAEKLGIVINGNDVVAYIAALVLHPAFAPLRGDDLPARRLCIPFTADRATFAEAAALGRTIVWLHTHGERLYDVDAGRPYGRTRLTVTRPLVPLDGRIPPDADTLAYDAAQQRLLVGSGYIEPVPPAVWRYEVSGKQVLVQWFSYRKKDRVRPIIGDHRQPSLLGQIQPDHWLPEYTTELLNVLNVLGWLVDLEPAQAALLEKICAGPTLSAADLRAAGCLAPAPGSPRIAETPDEPDLFAQL
jgi:hypothetical protein